MPEISPEKACAMRLKVCETFKSLLGESTYAGLPAYFIRLTGCNLRCRYCDTIYAYEEGRKVPLSRLVAAARAAGPDLVLVTGGEPLLQEGTPTLLRELLEAQMTVLLETNGSLSMAPVDTRVHRILDVKCPGSGMAEHNHWPNLEILTDRDEVKFVVADEADFNWAIDVVRQHRLAGRLPVLISPVFGVAPPAAAAAWILNSGLPLRLNLQLHKYIWNPEARGV